MFHAHHGDFADAGYGILLCINYFLLLALVSAGGAVRAAHTVFNGTTPDAFHGAVAVHVLPCGSLETTVTVGT